MNEQLERIKTKLRELKKLDANHSLFGSPSHKYELNSVLLLGQVKQFELTHKIILPKEYVAFLTKIGNGGAGPFYGVEPLENSLFDDLDYKRPDSLLNPSAPFVHTQPWNMEFNPTVDEEENEEEYYKQLSNFEGKYYAREHINGVIAVCNYGCAINLYLVVNGEEYGHIWTDDRGSNKGLFPSNELGNTERITFLAWYELWLDNSLSQLDNNLSPSNEIKQIWQKSKKPWWKVW